VIAGIGACIGIVVGSIGPWLRIYTFDLDGLDIGGSGNVTLTLGAASGVVLVTHREFRNSVAWSVPLLYGACVAGVACLSIAVSTIVRFASISTEILGAVIDVRVGWGLWLVAFCSATLSLTAARMAVQAGRQNAEETDSPDRRWPVLWACAAALSSATIVLCAVVLTWADVGRGRGAASLFDLVEHFQH
jgi:hypothetical protein